MFYVVFGCAGHYLTTSGKETPYIPSLGRRIKEWEFNEPVWQLLMDKLKKNGVTVHDCAPGERDVPLKERTDYANKLYWQYCAQYGKENVKAIYISEHYDALDGTFEGSNPSGFTVYVYTGQTNKESGKLAKYLSEELAKGTKQVNRGVKEGNLHIVRETAMPAALVENGFMDHPEESLLMLNKNFQEEVATEQARAICRYFGLVFKESIAPTTVEGNWTQLQGKWFYVLPDGNYKTGWLFYKNNWYLLGQDGAMLLGWQQVGDAWFYLKYPNGEMHKGWLQEGHKWFYLHPENGNMLTGIHVINGVTYKFAVNGGMI